MGDMMNGMDCITVFASKINVYGAVPDDELKDKSPTEQIA